MKYTQKGHKMDQMASCLKVFAFNLHLECLAQPISGV